MLDTQANGYKMQKNMHIGSKSHLVAKHNQSQITNLSNVPLVLKACKLNHLAHIHVILITQYIQRIY